MKRRELKKAIKEYANKTKFYRYGLIRQLILLKEKRHIALINAIPKVTCPNCGSNSIELEYSDSEYNSHAWLYCGDCDYDFDDTYGFEEAIGALYCEPYFDSLEVEIDLIMDGNVNHSYKWSLYCEEEIIKMLKYKI